MKMPFHYRRRRRNGDEGPKNSKQISVDFEDYQCIIDIDLHNIITKISRSRSPMDNLQGLLHSVNSAADEIQGEQVNLSKPQQTIDRVVFGNLIIFSQSYLINFTVLQRIHIAQLRVKLIQQAIDLRFKSQATSWMD
ncbi:hypothetical protein MFIFM68171_06605 [Madurella fahalii]|uniref:Uncharacterized protein n=1 Tax=Madurella fahalii TaxID=1157608 RepID=A0ABQ0GFS2_9PEZI